MENQILQIKIQRLVKLRCLLSVVTGKSVSLSGLRATRSSLGTAVIAQYCDNTQTSQPERSSDGGAGQAFLAWTRARWCPARASLRCCLQFQLTLHNSLSHWHFAKLGNICSSFVRLDETKNECQGPDNYVVCQWTANCEACPGQQEPVPNTPTTTTSTREVTNSNYHN